MIDIDKLINNGCESYFKECPLTEEMKMHLKNAMVFGMAMLCDALGSAAKKRVIDGFKERTDVANLKRTLDFLIDMNTTTKQLTLKSMELHTKRAPDGQTHYCPQG